MVRITETRTVFRSDLFRDNGTLSGYVFGIPPFPGWIEVKHDETGETVLYQWRQRIAGGGEYFTPDGKLRLVIMHTGPEDDV